MDNRFWAREQLLIDFISPPNFDHVTNNLWCEQVETPKNTVRKDVVLRMKK